MKATLLAADDPRWQTFLDVERHDFYHLPAYVTLAADQAGGRAVALSVSDGSRRLLLPLILRPIPYHGEDATSPYGYPGPLVAGVERDEFLSAALGEGLALLRSLGVTSVFLRSHPLLSPLLPTGHGIVVRGGDTVSVDLRASPETHWSQTMSGHRNQINRAIKSGFAAHLDSDWEHIGRFRELYQATMRRVDADESYFFDDAYFDRLREALGNRIRLWVVRADDGRIAAGGLFVEVDGLVQYHLSGADSKYARESPTKLMLHEVRAWAREHGARVLHLGGGVGSADDSLFRFKAGFSPLRHAFFTMRTVLDETAYQRLTELHVARVGGPVSSSYFPAYRAPAARADP